MTAYRLLRQDCRFENWSPMYIEGVDVPQLNSGVPVAELQTPVRVMLSAWGKEPSDFLERPCLVVSDAIRAVLDRAGVDNIQYFKAQLSMELSAQLFSGFWLANVIGKVSCADRLASHFESNDEGDGDGALQYLQIDPALTYGLSLFRLAEDSRMLVVSPRIQRLLQAAKLKGILFQDPNTYQFGRPISTEPKPDLHGGANP
jgi:hypothetical protein